MTELPFCQPIPHGSAEWWDSFNRRNRNDEWTEGRRYLGLDVLARCRIRAIAGHDTDSATEEVTIPALSA